MIKSVTEPQQRLNPFGPADSANAFFIQALSKVGFQNARSQPASLSLDLKPRPQTLRLLPAMEIEDYFTADIAESWSRCLPVWSKSGRVEDKPHGVRRPIYIPSLGKELGYEFALRFRDQWEFLVPKLESSSHLDRICAFDLLELIAWEYYTNCEDLPAAMGEIGSPIPEPALSDIHNEHFFKDFTGQTVGQFLPFLISHG